MTGALLLGLRARVTLRGRSWRHGPLRYFPTLLLLSAIALTGCRNSCQLICVRMAKVAEEDCGFTVPDEQLASCIDRHKSIDSKEDRAACREYNGIEDIRSEWDCELLAEYFGGGGGGGGQGDGSDATSE